MAADLGRRGARAPRGRGALLAFVEALSRSRLSGSLADITVFGVAGGALASALLLACAVCGVGLLCSGVMRWPGYWREPLRAHLLGRIGTDQTPAAGAASQTAVSFDVARQSDRITHHGAICGHPAVVSATLDWIRRVSRPC